MSTGLRNEDASSSNTSKTSEVTKFFEKLLKNPNSSQDESKRSNAENVLLRHTNMQAELNKTNGSKKE